MRKRCSSCSREFESKNAQKYCSAACKPNASGPNSYRLFQRDDFRCVYCSRSSIEDRVKLTLDHVIPYAVGGLDEAWNMATACDSCNRQKYAHSLGSATLDRILAEISERNKRAGIEPHEIVRGIGEAQRGRPRGPEVEPRSTTQVTPYPIRLPDELRENLESIALSEMRSLNAVIILALQAYVARHEPRAAHNSVGNAH